ncbi:hypothetical protein SDC9_108302 [bioreactor metagenome]|uniref:Uncharacterized protein n=1 Tax=bioreactor metagenome TaxID=1076179 RepID=A0A645BI76_9ZZZZ
MPGQTNNPLKEILNEVDTAITGKDGILEKITLLMNATDDKAQKSAIIGLIGSVIGLVVKCIKAAIPE